MALGHMVPHVTTKKVRACEQRGWRLYITILYSYESGLFITTLGFNYCLKPVINPFLRVIGLF
jgi:hypothetical protein